MLERARLLALEEIRGRERGWVLQGLLVRPEVGRGLPDRGSELCVLLVDALDEAVAVGRALDVARDVAGEGVEEAVDLGDRVRRRRLRELAQRLLGLLQVGLQLVLDLGQPASPRSGWRSARRKIGAVHLLVMSSDRIVLRHSVRFAVRSRRWYSNSSAAHGSFDAKKSSSSARASIHDTPARSVFESGCFTANQPFASGSRAFRTNPSQSSSSPCGMRSGLVSTPADGGALVSGGAWGWGQGECARTDGALAGGVVDFGKLVRALVFKVRCRSISACSVGEGLTRDVLSQVTVSRMRQLGLEMYDSTSARTSSMSLWLPVAPTLTIRPIPQTRVSDGGRGVDSKEPHPGGRQTRGPRRRTR